MKQVNCFNMLPVLLRPISTTESQTKLSVTATDANVAQRWHIKPRHLQLQETASSRHLSEGRRVEDFQ